MPHPSLLLSGPALLAECDVDTLRASGPGGQHRNKTESGVRLRHRPTGLVAHAYERRSQHENRAKALQRLRVMIALEKREPVDLDRFEISPALAAILPSTRGGRIGPNNEQYWPAVAALLDLFVVLGCSVRDTATALGVSTGALSRLLLDSPEVGARVNELRKQHGLRALRQG